MALQYFAEESSDENYVTKEMTRKATAFFDASIDTPFFLMLAPPNPHGEAAFLNTYDGYFDSLEAPVDDATTTRPSDKHYLMRYVPWPPSNKIVNLANEV